MTGSAAETKRSLSCGIRVHPVSAGAHRIRFQNRVRRAGQVVGSVEEEGRRLVARSGRVEVVALGEKLRAWN